MNGKFDFRPQKKYVVVVCGEMCGFRPVGAFIICSLHCIYEAVQIMEIPEGVASTTCREVRNTQDLIIAQHEVKRL